MVRRVAVASATRSAPLAYGLWPMVCREAVSGATRALRCLWPTYGAPYVRRCLSATRLCGASGTGYVSLG
eukprot:245500-Prymnesium_polylepis.1